MNSISAGQREIKESKQKQASKTAGEEERKRSIKQTAHWKIVVANKG